MLDNDNCSEELLMTAEEVRQRLSKYGASSEPPRDEAVVHPTDDRYGFFERGRDFASASTSHKYTTQERQMLAAYESLEYLPSHSTVYKNWIKKHPPRRDWQQWLMMGLIGFTVGSIGFLMHQLIDLINKFKWTRATDYLINASGALVWAWVTGISVALVALSASLVVFIRPQAASSGIPELMAFLNGTVVRHIFNVKTLVVKFLSCVCAVASGMPVGPEGPMIHMGSLVGAGLSQFKSDTMKFKLPCFERFRNFEDRRNFISAGAAAGVAAAFGAPVGGVLFSMEEVSSFWNMKLTWQIFFCAMISTFTADLFNSAFSGFVYQGSFGIFKAEEYILFKVQKGIPINILAFIPAVILGIIGGFLGALYTFVNLKIVKARRRILASLHQKWKRYVVKMGEPILIMIIVATTSLFLPVLFSCSSYVCQDGKNVRSNCNGSHSNGSRSPSLLHIDADVVRYKCPVGISVQYDNYTWTNSSYNEMATLLFGATEDAIHQLFSRNTHTQLSFIPLSVALVYYFTVSCFAAGTSIASGILIPMLFIGGLYGRMVGLAVVSLFGVDTEENSYGAWMDPGAFALVGAASFFGGVSRLTMSLAVIMIEMTNDVQFLLPIMASIMVAKWVGDFFTHPYYLSLMELKCIPYLDAEPIVKCNGHTVPLELHSAQDIMAFPPVVVRVRESIIRLSELLLNTNHGGFPVVRKATNGEDVFFGSINRLQLAVLLKNRHLFIHNPSTDLDGDRFSSFGHLDYPQLTLDKLENPELIEDMLLSYVHDEELKDAYINLEPYVNQSAVSIPGKFSLERTYIIFRTLGLRHMSVVDELNRVIGIITRKDLMGFNMAEKLLTKEQLPQDRRSRFGEIGDDEELLLLTESD